MYIAVCDDQESELEVLTGLLRRWQTERRTSLRFQTFRSAAELLTSTDLPISDISRRCGYENPFYFSRVFRERMGMPPSEYRRAAIL